jgi:mRNA interferase RelE/StbE
LKYRIEFTQTGKEMLSQDISDVRIKKQILKRIERLDTDPEKQGEPLVGELSGFRKIRVAKKRFRIIYKIDRNSRTVYIFAVGIRKEGNKSDVYHKAKKLLGLI